MADSPEEHVRDWLKTSGAGLEFKTAEAFRRVLGDRDVDHAFYYRELIGSDGGERKLREVDVVARPRWNGEPQATGARISVTMVVECKTTSTPWALYTSDSIHLIEDHDFLMTLMLRTQVESLPRRLSLVDNRFLKPVERHAYQVVDASKSRNDGNKQRNTAWDAVRQVLDAATSISEELTVVQGQAIPTLAIFVPILVTSAPLISVSMDASGGFKTTAVDSMPLIARLRPPVKRNPVFKTQLSGIWIVQESALDDFVRKSAQSVANLRLAPVAP